MFTPGSPSPEQPTRYFDFGLIDEMEGAPMERLTQPLRAYLLRDGDAADRVCFAIILWYVDTSERYLEVSTTMSGFLAAIGARGQEGKYCQTQSDLYGKIAQLSPRELAGRELNLDALEAVGTGPVGDRPEEVLVRARIIDLGERANRQRARRLIKAARKAKKMLEQGQPLAEVLKYLDEFMTRPEAPQRARKRPEAQVPVAQEMELLGRRLQQLVPDLPADQEVARRLLEVLKPVWQLLEQRAGGGPQEENPGMPGFVAKADAPDESTAGSARGDNQAPVAAPAPATAPAPAPRVEQRQYPREENPGMPGTVNAREEDLGTPGDLGDEDEDGDDVPDDYYLPMVHAVMAALEPAAQRELGEVLTNVVAGVEVDTFAPTLYNLWEHCELEAAGVNEEHFDFFMGQMCGPDWGLRGQHALVFLKAAEPPDWGWHMHGLRTVELPAVLKAEVAAICQRLPPVEVDVPGDDPQAQQERDVAIVVRAMQRVLPDIDRAPPHLQRDLLADVYELSRRLRAQGFIGTNPQPMPAKTMSFGSLVWKV